MLCREFLSTEEGVAVLASAEGQRQLQNRLDWTGLNMEQLASLEPLRQISANIHEIDLSGCKKLKHLPIESLMELLPLKRLILNDCPALLFPPKEIACRDGAAVVMFLRHRYAAAVGCLCVRVTHTVSSMYNGILVFLFLVYIFIRYI